MIAVIAATKSKELAVSLTGTFIQMGTDLLLCSQRHAHMCQQSGRHQLKFHPCRSQ